MTTTIAASPTRSTRWQQYSALTKPRVVQLIVFCAVIGMLLAVPGMPDLRLAAAATVGIWLVASAAAAFNCLVEQQIDRKMARTRSRPTVAGTISTWQIVLLASVVGSIGRPAFAYSSVRYSASAQKCGGVQA